MYHNEPQRLFLFGIRFKIRPFCWSLPVFWRADGADFLLRGCVGWTESGHMTGSQVASTCRAAVLREGGRHRELMLQGSHTHRSRVIQRRLHNQEGNVPNTGNTPDGATTCSSSPSCPRLFHISSELFPPSASACRSQRVGSCWRFRCLTGHSKAGAPPGDTQRPNWF